jgi:cytochrome b561
MNKTQKTALPMETPKTQKLAVKLIHLGMYGTLGTIALTGLMVGLIFWLG